MIEEPAYVVSVRIPLTAFELPPKRFVNALDLELQDAEDQFAHEYERRNPDARL